ncbi:streptogrisin B precursor [Actinomadura sp. KC216]|uniref:S1 family peptidase n=1 Tax=Actinomadura sp. KC216 TaxID=2530370 RepID=UPI00105307CE|nr:S1 family peptidase [Actinomadura sp. KC216]TDB89976.1 streptogrisin B precursor [Actinomadura sp. KC216]
MRPRFSVITTVAMATAAMVALAPAAAATAPTAATGQDARSAAAKPPPSGEGGQPIFAKGGVRCTIGFNVRKSNTYYFITAGGCAKSGQKIYADPGLTVELGTVVSVTNVAVALVVYVEPHVERPGSVLGYPGSRDITGPGQATVGQPVCRSGSTTGVRCGTVTALNQSVSFPEGTMTGLARTNICSEPGDNPGAPYFAGTLALGVGIGGSGNCTSGGTSFYQPINEILSAYDVNVY